MPEFIIFALFLCFAAFCLIVWPLLLHPTLPLKRKIILTVLTFVLLVPVALLLYTWLGVPQLAV